MVHRTREQKILTQLKRLQTQLKETNQPQTISLKSASPNTQQAFTTSPVNIMLKTSLVTTKNIIEDYSYIRNDLLRILSLTVLAFALEAMIYLTGIV